MSTMVTDNSHTASPWRCQTARVVGIQPETPGVRTYTLRIDDQQFARHYTFRPGQFNMLYMPGVGEAAISMSSDADQPETIRHTVRVAGNVTRALSALTPGAQVGVRGPFGQPWPVEACRGQDVVIACGGIGLAPLRPMLYHIMRRRADFRRVFLLYGARTPRDLLYTDEYESWRAAGIEVQLTADMGETGWEGAIGVVPVLFYRIHLQPQRTIVLTCGPEIMMRYVIFEALARKAPANRVYLSMERHMNCAIGLCGHCQLGPVFVCRDGPVFTYERMEPYLRLEDL